MKAYAIVGCFFVIFALYSVNCTANANEELDEEIDENQLIVKTLEKLIEENASQNELIEYIVLSIRKIQKQLDEFDSENLGEKKKRSSSDEVKRSRKQLFSSGLQGVWGVPGKK